MSERTKNYKLIKPGEEDFYNINEFNTNFDLIDKVLGESIPQKQKGAPDGVASLDDNGRVLPSQLPPYVDDVLEYPRKAEFPSDGESGKIYVDIATNLTYRWSGSTYVEISPSLALGETLSTAYRGDRGKIAYEHSQKAHARVDATKTAASNVSGNIKINDAEVQVFDKTELSNNQVGNKSAEGAFLTIDSPNLKPVLTNLEMQGKSEQLQTTGKNLFDKNAVTSGMYINNSNGELTNNSVCSASDYIDVTNLENICIMAETTGARWGAFYNASKTFISGISAYGIVKIPTGAAYLRITVTTAAIGTAQIEAGTAATAYESYTGGKPAPSPDYPQEIKSVENPAITVCGKNLCPSTGKSATLYGITYKRNEDGSITFSGTNTTSNTLRFNTEKIFLPAGNYTLSGITGGSATTYALRIGIGRADTWKLEIYDGQRTFTLSEPTLTTATLVVKPGTYSNVTVYPQIEKGTTSTPYEPYAGHTAALTDITLRSLPDGTADKLEKRDGVCGIERYTEQYVADGSGDETWEEKVINTTWYAHRLRITDGELFNNKSRMLCSRFIILDATKWGTFEGNGAFVNITPNAGYVYFHTSDNKNLAEFKTWLSDNPVTIVYALATPIWEPLPDALQAELNKLESHVGQTNIFTDSALQPEMIAEHKQIVPIEFGGTGTTTLEDARDILGIGDINSVLDSINGKMV